MTQEAGYALSADGKLEHRRKRIARNSCDSSCRRPKTTERNRLRPARGRVVGRGGPTHHLSSTDQSERPTSFQSFSGYGWEEATEPASNVRVYYLAGSFETYAGAGGTAARPTYGWFARLDVPA